MFVQQIFWYLNHCNYFKDIYKDYVWHINIIAEYKTW